jgi:SAM-dependent methyltransferase
LAKTVAEDQVTSSYKGWDILNTEARQMTKHHHPQHQFDPAKAQKLLDPKWRLIDDPVQLVRQMGIKPGQYVVDLGCGAGFFSKALLEAVGNNGRVTAVDVQQPVLDVFHSHVGQRPNLEVKEADLCRTGLESGQYDVAFIAFTLHEVKVVDALLEVSRILKPGGLLIALEWGNIDPCPERDGKRVGPPEGHRLLPTTLLYQLDEAGFKAINQEERLEGCQYWVVAQSGGV